MESPAPALPRAVLWTIAAALVFALLWASLGRIDVVAVAVGKVIAAGKAKLIQPVETAVVKRILVADGQTVKAGDVLIELEAAATATGAETARTREALVAARLESARHEALARAAQGTAAQPQFHSPSAGLGNGAGACATPPCHSEPSEESVLGRIPQRLIDSEIRAMQSQYQEHRARLASLDAEIAKRASQLEQELVKAQTREKQQILTAPVDGTVQQLAVHTVGGVVTPAQALMVIAPADYRAEVEAFLENEDVGFVKVGQRAEVKVETFPFICCGTLRGTVSFVSNDAVADEKRGLVFQARVKLDQASLKVDERQVTLTPGMAVSAEIATGDRRVIEFFLDPVRKTVSEGLRER